jgi:ABC-type uncharacterized transport system ATPase subunit
MASPLLKMNNITKRFPGVIANENVNLEIYRGEVHALLGENGAGKSTLMSILSGFYKADGGYISINDKKVVFNSPKDSIKAGIGMVHQHFKLVDCLTVTENIILGLKGISHFYDLEKLHDQIGQFSKKYGLKVDPRAEIWQLSVGEQQRVEILKMLYRNVDVLILDEPTAVLTPREVEELFITLRNMAGEGKAIIVITHKLNEVMNVADRITVLRQGKTVATLMKNQTSKQELSRLMVGREVFFTYEKVDTEQKKSKVLSIKNVTVLNDKKVKALVDFSLDVHSGEILGIAGVAGNGQRELTEVIAGLRPVISGEIILEDNDLTNALPKIIIDSGVSLIPEDRMNTGLIGNLNIIQNLILKCFNEREFSNRGFFYLDYLNKYCTELISRFDIKTAGIHSPVKLMSGGNQQKLLLAREVSKRPKLIVAAYPSRGLDVGATQAIHNILLKQRSEGTAVIMISEDLDEIFSLSDRIAVMYEGKIMGIVKPQETDFESIGLMMCGEERAC